MIIIWLIFFELYLIVIGKLLEVLYFLLLEEKLLGGRMEDIFFLLLFVSGIRVIVMGS